MPSHIISYHIISYHIISYPIPLFLTLILSSNIISCHAFFLRMYPPILLTWNMPWWNEKFDVFIFVWNVFWLRIYYFHLNTSHSISLHTYQACLFSSTRQAEHYSITECNHTSRRMHTDIYIHIHKLVNIHTLMNCAHLTQTDPIN